ncbi:MAG: iron-sulfur cluster repair di-iron protein [Eubacteriales bacterium]
MKINLKSTLGEIVSLYPNTASVMNKYKIDYCCGGKNTLENALSENSLNCEKVVSELEKEAEEIKLDNITNWNNESLSKIVDYILDKHHTFMKKALEEINILMFKILKVHYNTNGESLLVIHNLFGQLKTELEEHLVKEEENLFPLIKEYELNDREADKNSILKFIAETESEHDKAGDLFKALEAATNDFTPPENACASYIRTFKLLDALEKDTFNHIHMENSILFPRI